MQRIADIISRYSAPPKAEVDRFLASAEMRTLAPGEHFCVIGQTSYEVAVVLSGTMRVYYVWPDGRETTVDFLFPEMIAAPFYAASLGAPSPTGIEALTECRLAVWPYSIRDELIATGSHEWMRLVGAVLDESFRRKWRQTMILQMRDATERYVEVMKIFPDAFRSVRLSYVASYLGITPQHLSRIRAKLGM